MSDKCFGKLILQLRHFVGYKFPQVLQISLLFTDEFFTSKVCVKFNVMIDVNKGTFYEKQIQELSFNLLLNNISADSNF